MFTNINKKSFGLVSLFAFMFTLFVSSFFLSLNKVEAFSVNTTSTNISYSINKVLTPTKFGNTYTYTNTIIIGCLPQSGDLYDMNTGKPCINDKTSTIVLGCTPRSGDVYDINTGKKCVYDDKTIVIVGCAPRSNDIYNINTGRICIPKQIVKQVVDKKVTTVKLDTNNIISKNDTAISTTISQNQIDGEANVLADNTQDDSLSGREMISKNLSASVAKIGSTFKGPLSVWIILFVIIILAGGIYGLYSFGFFGKKDDIENLTDTIVADTTVSK